MSFDNPFIELPEKSDIVHTVISLCGVINVRETHCNDDYLFMTPIDTSLFISFIRAALALCVCGIGYGLP
jgi:hypothetical protein